MKETDELLDLLGDNPSADEANASDSDDLPKFKPKPVLKKAGSRRPTKPRKSPYVFNLLKFVYDRIGPLPYDSQSAVKSFLDKVARLERVKMHRASRLDRETVEKSAFTMGFAGMFKMANPEADERKTSSTVAFLDAKMPSETKAILGKKIVTSKEFLKIDSASLEDLKKIDVYISNTMFVGSPSIGPHRSQAVIGAYLEAVPEDMLDVPWKKLKCAHPLKQGARRSSKVPCAVERCPYGDGKGTCLAGHIDGRLIYVCGRVCYSHMAYRDIYENAQ